MASSALEPQSAQLHRFLGSKEELTPILITFIIGLLTLVLAVFFWMIRGAVKASPTSDVPPKITSRPKDLRPMPSVNDEEAFWKTWLSRDETLVWPKVWLAQKFPGARILSISYDSAIQKSPEQMDMYLVIENLIQDIIWGSTCNAGQNCPVIFAGHCFGGLIIKAFLLKCDEEVNLRSPSTLNEETKKNVRELKNFLENCKAILYYSPPAGGARVKSRALLTYPNCFSGDVNQRLVDFLRILSPETSRINEKFMHLQEKFKPRLTTRAIGAKKKWKTKLSDFEVPEGSARLHADSIYWASADHFAVSRAKDNFTCKSFMALRELVDTHYTVSSSLSTDREVTGEEIAEKVGITFAQLEAANPGVNWNDLNVGQVLKTPGSRSRSSTTTYNVVFDDTGENIAQKLGITFRELGDANPNVKWNALNIGQVLNVRGITFVQLEAANPGVDWNSLYIGQGLKVRDSGSWSSTTYKVVSGDTGQKIAQKFGMRFSELEALNWNNLTLKVPTSSGCGGDGDGGGKKKNKIRKREII